MSDRSAKAFGALSPLVIGLSVLSFWISACRSDSDTTTEPAQASTCLTVAKPVQAAIREGMKDGTGAKLSNFRAVRSRDFRSVYFVSARLVGPGIDERPATFAVGSSVTDAIRMSGIFAVGGTAHEFTGWGPGESTDADMNQSNHGYRQSQDCVA